MNGYLQAYQQSVTNRLLGMLSAMLHHFIIKANANSKADVEKPAGEAAAVTTLTIKDHDETEIIRLQEVIWLQSDNNCVAIQTIQKKYITDRSLRALEKELDAVIFVRIHRAAIVNRTFIQAIHHLPGGDGFVELTTNETIRYSRNYKKGVMG